MSFDLSMLDQIENEDILAWIFNRNICNERGEPISFDNHAFMMDPYRDWTPRQGVRKGSQCGWSVMTNIKLFYAARFGIPGYGIKAANVIYTLPSDSDVNMFVPSKTNLLIKNNETISNFLRDESGNRPDADSIQRKKIGQAMVYFKGTRSKTAAIMLTADLNIHDEADRSEPAIIDEYESRVGASLYQGRWIFSNPSAPGMPADAMFEEGDQKHWFITCTHCGHRQYLDWIPLSEHEFVANQLHCYVDDEKGHYICSRCGQIISDDNRKRGNWIRKYQSKDTSSYWVSQFMYPWVSCKKLLETRRTKSTSYFMNFVRGLPYVGSDVVVDGKTIVANMILQKPEYQRGRVAMGIDVMNELYFVIGNEQGIFHIGKTKKWEDIQQLIDQYDPYCVVDLNPYPAAARQLAERNRRVWCSYYIEESKNFELIDWGSGDKVNMVYPVRNLLFDDLISYIAHGQMKFFGPKGDWIEYIAHWERMYRADMIGDRLASEYGESAAAPPGKVMRGVWRATSKEDHWCHATLYYYVALSRMRTGQAKILSSQSADQIIRQHLGGVPVSPRVENGLMTPTHNMVDVKELIKPKAKPVATSGNV